MAAMSLSACKLTLAEDAHFAHKTVSAAVAFGPGMALGP